MRFRRSRPAMRSRCTGLSVDDGLVAAVKGAIWDEEP